MNVVEMTEVAEGLRAAKADLEREGWFQGTWFEAGRVQIDDDLVMTYPPGRACLKGALLRSGVDGRAFDNACTTLSVCAGLEDNWIEVWQDSPGRTAEDVLDLLDQAMHLLENMTDGSSA